MGIKGMKWTVKKEKKNIFRWIVYFIKDFLKWFFISSGVTFWVYYLVFKFAKKVEE